MMRIAAVFFVFLLVLGIMPTRGFVASAPQAYAEEGEGGGGKEGKEGKHPDFEYIQLTPILLPVITTKGPTQQLNLLVQLEVPFGKKEDVNVYVPRLVDAYLQDLYGALSAGRGMMSNGVINVVEIKKRLSSATDRVMGEKREDIKDILLQVLQQRQL